MAGQKIYCVKCRKKTDNNGEAQIRKTKTGRHFLSVKCNSCGSNKTRFISKQDAESAQGSGLLSGLPIVGPIIDAIV